MASPLSRNAQTPSRPQKLLAVSAPDDYTVILFSTLREIHRIDMIGNGSASERDSRDVCSVAFEQERPILRLPDKPTDLRREPEVGMPHVLWAQKDDKWGWTNYNSLPPETTATLVDCFLEVVNGSDSKRYRWGQITRIQDTYRFDSRPACIREQLAMLLIVHGAGLVGINNGHATYESR